MTTNYGTSLNSSILSCKLMQQLSIYWKKNVSFVANIVSSTTLIVTLSGSKRCMRIGQRYGTVLKRQIWHPKDIILSPLLIIVFVMKRIKNNGQIYVLLTTYLVALIPFIATFRILVLPRQFYLKIFSGKEFCEIWVKHSSYKWLRHLCNGFFRWI